MSDHRTWLITGISRGLGRALTETLLAGGATVVGTTRDGTSDLAADPGTLHVLPIDLADPRGPAGVVDRAFAIAGRIDVIVNNAGYTLLGSIEDAEDEAVERLFAVNVLGPARIIRAALPRLRGQGSGHIVNITSVQASDPGAAVGYYAASKAAMEALSRALALEVELLGLRVTAVAPGGLRTCFLSDRSALRSGADVAPAYRDSVGAALDRFAQIGGRQPGDPRRAAAAIIAAVDADDPPQHLLLGSDALERAGRCMADATAEHARWDALSRSTDIREDEHA